MIYEIDKYTDFLVKQGITPNQFYICWLLHTKDSRNQEEFLKVGFVRDDFTVLIQKGLLININPNATAYNMTNLFVSPEFAEAVLVEPEEAWEELFDAYPNYLLINNNKVPAKTLTYQDTKGVEATYASIIKKNKFLHARVISAVNIMKSQNNGYAPIKIDKFVMGKHWETIEGEDNNGIAKPSFY